MTERTPPTSAPSTTPTTAEVKALLARNPAIAALGEDLIAALAAAAKPVMLSKGHTRRAADGALLVLSGTARITSYDPDEDEQRTLTRLQPGDVAFSERLFEPTPKKSELKSRRTGDGDICTSRRFRIGVRFDETIVGSLWLSDATRSHRKQHD